MSVTYLFYFKRDIMLRLLNFKFYFQIFHLIFYLKLIVAHCLCRVFYQIKLVPNLSQYPGVEKSNRIFTDLLWNGLSGVTAKWEITVFNADITSQIHYLMCWFMLDETSFGQVNWNSIVDTINSHAKIMVVESSKYCSLS